MRNLAITIALACCAAMVGAQPVASPSVARVIVRFKADSSLARMQVQSEALHKKHAARALALGRRVGIALRGGSAIDDRTQVVFAEGMGSTELVAKLRAQHDVESAEPDRRRRVHVAPNDPYYFTGPPADGPEAGQWYLRAPDATVRSSIDVESAWSISTGSAQIVVAVLDTGVRFEHRDLGKTASGGNLLPGFDMISDQAIANDGDGRDGDASDSGDWVTSAESANDGPFKNCAVTDSSWHGTHMAGIIAATTNNGFGMASIGRSVRVLPVRVLGKCGGFDSDIIAGMRWAAGLAVPDVPINPNPARIVNLSLGSAGACSDAYRSAIAELRAVGVTVVSSAGNSAGHAVSTPANCPGVIAVAGLRHAGTKVGFSDLGPEIAISAPGGNCVETTPGAACRYPIVTTTNEGAQRPLADSSAFTNSFQTSLGTSYAAPMVAATAALMLSVQASLGPDELRARIRQSARPFPQSGADNGSDPTPVRRCTAPQNDAAGSPVEQPQCYCTTTTCGAGMLDAGGAVRGALAPAARITTAPQFAVVGETLTLSATSSSAAQGRSIARVRWSLTDGGGIVTAFTSPSDAMTVTLRPTAAGRFQVALAITDDRATTTSTAATIQVFAPSQKPSPTGAEGSSGGDTDGGGGGGAMQWKWLVGLLAAVVALHRARARDARARL